MIIALPSEHHDHLADALVRDLGFTRRHVDAPLRELLLKLDPLVDSGVAMANMGPSPRLSSKLEQLGGTSDEDRWTRLLHPPRPGAVPDRVAAEVKRLLEVLREEGTAIDPINYDTGDVVEMGDDPLGCHAFIAIDGRYDGEAAVGHWISPSGVVGEQEAIVRYVQDLRTRAQAIGVQGRIAPLTVNPVEMLDDVTAVPAEG